MAPLPPVGDRSHTVIAKHELAGKESYVIGNCSHSFHLTWSIRVPLHSEGIVLSLGSKRFISGLNRDGQGF